MNTTTMIKYSQGYGYGYKYEYIYGYWEGWELSNIFCQQIRLILVFEIWNFDEVIKKLHSLRYLALILLIVALTHWVTIHSLSAQKHSLSLSPIIWPQNFIDFSNFA